MPWSCCGTFLLKATYLLLPPVLGTLVGCQNLNRRSPIHPLVTSGQGERGKSWHFSVWLLRQQQHPCCFHGNTIYSLLIGQVTCFPATCDLLCEVQLVAVARWKTAHTTLNTNLIWPPLCICIESKRWFHSTFWLCFAFYYILSNTLNGQPLWLAYLGLFTIPKMERKKNLQCFVM